IRELHLRWKRFLEVAVYRPVRGYVDLVIHDPPERVVVATEFHSQIHRVEQQLRWGYAKANALLDGSDLPLIDPDDGTRPTISRLLVLRSTRTNRELVGAYRETFRTAFPAATEAAARALRGEGPWPGAAIVWMRVD